MSIDILMPALSPTMEKGNLAKWLKKEGDAIKSGDVLAEIETDKATMEIEAVDEGILAKILVPSGTADVLVNQCIGVIAEEGEDAGKVQAQGKAAASVAPVAAVSAAVAAPVVAAQAVAAASGKRVFATPLARRMAEQKGIDLSRVVGSGPHGRIVMNDVLGGSGAAPQKAVAASAPVAQPLATSASSDAVKAMYEAGSYSEVMLDNMRKTIARRLVESKQTVPHFYLSVDCDLGQLLNARAQINDSAPKGADGKPSYKLSVNDFIIKAMAVALQRVPDANVVWAEDRILKFNHSDVGVAVSVEGGLFTPVIREAELKGLAIISAEMKDLASRARNRKLKPHEYQGGSTAISNLGMFGIQNFSAVINPPHATILAVGAGEERAVVRNGVLCVANMMSVTLSTDHRAVDGALGAQLLSVFKDLIENPVKLVV